MDSWGEPTQVEEKPLSKQDQVIEFINTKLESTLFLSGDKPSQLDRDYFNRLDPSVHSKVKDWVDRINQFSETQMKQWPLH